MVSRIWKLWFRLSCWGLPISTPTSVVVRWLSWQIILLSSPCWRYLTCQVNMLGGGLECMGEGWSWWQLCMELNDTMRVQMCCLRAPAHLSQPTRLVRVKLNCQLLQRMRVLICPPCYRLCQPPGMRWIMQGSSRRILKLYIEHDILPDDPSQTKKLVAKGFQFVVVGGVLVNLGLQHKNFQWIALPNHLHTNILSESHGSRYGGHFSGPKLYNALAWCWWWPRMYTDVLSYYKSCPLCAVVTRARCQHRSPLQPIPVPYHPRLLVWT